jgi:hypothetical protein
MKTHLDGLTSRLVERTSRSDLPLVTDHVTKTLVVDDSDVDIGVELLARDTRIHRLVSVVVVPGGLELLPEVLQRRVVFREVERRSVLRETVHRSGFGSDRLDEHTDGHTGGEGVRVDDDVRLHARLGEGHVDGGVLLRADSLLSVTGGELVTDDGRTGDAELDVELLGVRFGRVVACEEKCELERERVEKRRK